MAQEGEDAEQKKRNRTVGSSTYDIIISRNPE